MITQEDIVKVVVDYYNVSYKDVLVKYNHEYPECIAKDLIIYLYRHTLHMKITEIARHFKMTPRNIGYRIKHLNSKLSGKSKLASEYKEIIEILTKK